MLVDFFFDFETKCEDPSCDLVQNGTVRYAMNPKTSATLLTWAFGRNSPVKSWRIGQPFPQELIDVAMFPEKYHFIAHKVMFDYCIWTMVLPRQLASFNFRIPSIKNISDNMAITTYYRMGAALDGAAKMLQLPYSKDKEGRKLMLKQSSGKPLTPEEWNRFEFYGITDTRLLRDIYYMLPPLPSAERYAWEWTFKRNLKGLRVDMKLINELNSIIEACVPFYYQEFFRLTAGRATVNSPIKSKEFFQQYYPEIEDMQAETVEDLLLDDRPVPPHVKRALEVKELAGGSAISKISKAKSIEVYGYIFDILAYAHAHTRRWAGRGLQVHNFAAFDKDRSDKIDFDLNVHDLTYEIYKRIPLLQDPLGFVKNLLRRIFIPDEGKSFYGGDWAKIEPTAMFWLLGMGSIPDKVYEDTAAAIYMMSPTDVTKDSIERQIGKMAFLSCQYGAGWETFKKQVKKKAGLTITEELAKASISGYRKKYPQVVAFWDALEYGFRKAIHGETTVLYGGKLHIMPMTYPVKGVQIRLPSGGALFYPYAQETKGHWVYEFDKKKRPVLDENGKQKKEWRAPGFAYLTEGKAYPIKKYVYGGLLAENVVSSIARELSIPAIYNLETNGFEVLNFVHDELWGQGTPGRLQEYERLMCINPSWCPDMRIKAEVTEGVRYLK